MDLFELKSANITIRIAGVDHKMVDPRVPVKIGLQKEFKAWESSKDKVDEDVFLSTGYDLNKKQVKMYLPTLSDEIMEAMGEGQLTALVAKIVELAENKFGAVVERVEKK